VFSRDDSAQPDSSIIRYNVSQNDGFDDNASTSILHLFMFTQRGGEFTYNNTFYNQPGGGFYMNPSSGSSLNGPNTFENNIFIGSDANWNETNGSGLTYNTYNNNWYFYNGPDGYTPPGSQEPMKGSNLPASDGTAEDFTADPCLEGNYHGNSWDSTRDYRLSINSGKLLGAAIPIVHLGIHDFWGFPSDASRNIGADDSTGGQSKAHSFRFFGR